jgi:hypothetical protein
MLAPTLCVYWTLEYVDISNLPEKIAFVKPCAGYLGHPFAKKIGVLIIFACFSELWLSQMKGYLNISHVYIHHVDTVHLLFQGKLTGRKVLSCIPKTS